MKILIIGGLGHLGFELTKLIKETLPDSQVTIVDDLSGNLFNYDQKLGFINHNKLATGVFKDLPNDLHTYDLAFDFTLPKVSDFGYQFSKIPNQPVNPEVIRQALAFYALPCKHKVLIADYTMGRLLSRIVAFDSNLLNSYMHILPDCIGGVNVKGSVLYSMRNHLKGQLISHKATDKAVRLLITPTVDALFSILQITIDKMYKSPTPPKIYLYVGTPTSLYLFKRKCVVALCKAYPEATKEVSTREGLVFSNCPRENPQTDVTGVNGFRGIISLYPTAIKYVTLDTPKRVDMALLRIAQTAVKFHLAGIQ